MHNDNGEENKNLNLEDVMNYLDNKDVNIDDLLSSIQDVLANNDNIDTNVVFDFINDEYQDENEYIFNTSNKEEEKDSNKQMHSEMMKNFNNMSGGHSY